MRAIVRFLSRLFGFTIVIALAGVGWMVYFSQMPLGLKSTPLDVTILTGSNMKQVARQLTTAGIDMPAWQFTLLARAVGKATNIKAGSYEVAQGITPWGLLEKLTRGDVTQADLVFVEGWTFRQFRAALDKHPSITHDTAGLSDQQILEKIGISASQSSYSAEGLFFPDTYLFAKNSSDLDILKRAHRLMQQALAAEWDKRAPGLPYATPYEALIMASIVEKETGQAQDRALVAAVFVNRLRTGMRLQTDPTVIYGLGERFDGNLRKPDLLTDTPYNTYTRAGLPPSPIAMPGLASLQAALHPAQKDIYYFVAKGNGSSYFSRTLDEHNRAVNKYQRKRGS